MRSWRHQFAAKQQYAKERCLKEEGSQPLIGEEWPQNVGRRVGKAAPVGAELERHDHAGHDAHAEGNREDLDPELGYVKVDCPAGDEMQSFQGGNE